MSVGGPAGKSGGGRGFNPKAAGSYYVLATTKLHLGLEGVQEDFDTAVSLVLKPPAFNEWLKEGA